MTDTSGTERNTSSVSECEDCGGRDVPLRSIMMRGGTRELLCEDCFLQALEDDHVHPEDPRLGTLGGRNV